MQLLIYKENSTNCYFPIYLLGWETLVNIQDPSKYLLDGHSLPLLIEELERLSEVHKEDKNLLTLHT